MSKVPTTHKTELSLLGLPPELRALIYEAFFHWVCSPAVNPFERLLPPANRLFQVEDLFLVNRQVYSEAKPLWRKVWRPRSTFYFDNVSELHDLKLESQRNPQLAEMRFHVRTRFAGGLSDLMVLQLLGQQPDYKIACQRDVKLAEMLFHVCSRRTGGVADGMLLRLPGQHPGYDCQPAHVLPTEHISAREYWAWLLARCHPTLDDWLLRTADWREPVDDCPCQGLVTDCAQSRRIEVPLNKTCRLVVHSHNMTAYARTDEQNLGIDLQASWRPLYAREQIGLAFEGQLRDLWMEFDERNIGPGGQYTSSTSWHGWAFAKCVLEHPPRRWRHDRPWLHCKYCRMVEVEEWSEGEPYYNTWESQYEYGLVDFGHSDIVEVVLAEAETER